MDEQNSGGILAWVQAHPSTSLLIAAGLIIGYIFISKNGPVQEQQQQPQADLSGLARDANGNPIVYRDVADTFINIVDNSRTYNGSTDNEHPIEPVPSSPPANNPSTTTGLLGAGAVGFNFSDLGHIPYQQNGQNKVTSLPPNTRIIPGGSGRIWYVLPGETQQRLLTSGWGGPVTQ